MIHTIQDFYSYPNWVELHVDTNPIPVWDLELGTLTQGVMSGLAFAAALADIQLWFARFAEVIHDNP